MNKEFGKAGSRSLRYVIIMTATLAGGMYWVPTVLCFYWPQGVDLIQHGFGDKT